MKPRILGGREIAPVALGGARWSLSDDPDESLAAETLRAALDAGVGLVDTAPAYTPPGVQHHNESVIAKVIKDEIRAGEVTLSTKGGHGRSGDGTFWIDGRPETLRSQCDGSLATLGIDTIPLYSLHWPDPKVPLAESVGALAELREEGKIRLVGLCNVGSDEVEQAHEITRIDAVQNRLSALDLPDCDMLRLCREHDVTFLAYSPFGGANAATLSSNQTLQSVADRHHVSVYRVAIRWMLERDGILPIVGAGRPSSIEDAVAGRQLELSEDDLTVLSNSLA